MCKWSHLAPFCWFYDGAVKFHLLLHYSFCLVQVSVSGCGSKQLLLRQRMSFKRSFSLTWGRFWPWKSCWITTQAHQLNNFSKIFFPETWQTNFRSCSTRELHFFLSTIGLIPYFPLKVNSGRFLTLLVTFRNTATPRHIGNKTKQIKDDARVFLGNTVKTKHQRLTNLAFM